VIVKDLDPFPPTDDVRARAGRRVEEDQAYYLRRAFAQSPRIHVLHGLRLDGRDVVQIDHLILHRHGLVIVETKSLQEAWINELEEWTRSSPDGPKGMASPLIQAEMQAAGLRTYLHERQAPLGDRLVRRRARRALALPIDVMVGYASDGQVHRPPLSFLNVLKVEQVPGYVTALVAGRWPRGAVTLRPREIAQLGGFLCLHHTPDPRPRR